MIMSIGGSCISNKGNCILLDTVIFYFTLNLNIMNYHEIKAEEYLKYKNACEEYNRNNPDSFKLESIIEILTKKLQITSFLNCLEYNIESTFSYSTFINEMYDGKYTCVSIMSNNNIMNIICYDSKTNKTMTVSVVNHHFKYVDIINELDILITIMKEDKKLLSVVIEDWKNEKCSIYFTKQGENTLFESDVIRPISEIGFKEFAFRYGMGIPLSEVKSNYIYHLRQEVIYNKKYE